MAKLKIATSLNDGITIVPNKFIDQYMIHAGGEYVKVYLYLLRMLGKSNAEFTVTMIADALEMTEKDVLRAIRYWERTYLISLDYSEEGTLERICLNDIDTSDTTTPSPTQDENNHNQKIEELSIDPKEAESLLENPEITQLLFIAETYLGKMLSQIEVNRILYFYQKLEFSADLIEYLIEYCVSRNIKNIKYMEKIAFDWYKQKITTVKEAKNLGQNTHKEYYSILKTFGITDRKPGKPEIEYMDTWISDFGFSMDVIEEAVHRTIQQTHRPSFQYANKILTRWSDAGVKNVGDVATLDEEHKKSKPVRTNPSRAKSFNQFTEREYDFNHLEKLLLHQ